MNSIPTCVFNCSDERVQLNLPYPHGYQEGLGWFYRLLWYDVVFITLFIAVFICGTTGNFLVCFVIWKNVEMRNVTNVFIVNLAISDLLVLIIVLIPSMIQDIFRVWFLGVTGCKVLSFLQRVSIIVSILTLIAISIERYYAICHPLKFNATPTRVLVIIAAIWVIAMAFSSPELFFAETSSTTDWVCGQKTLNVVYSYIFIIGFYIIPFIIMTGAYIKIARSLWISHVEELSATGCRSQLGSEGVLSQLTQRRRAARMLIVVVVCFFLCYLLHNTFVLLIIHGDYQQWDVDDLMAVITAGHLLIYANSAANPIIYNFMCEKFRGAFLTVCRCCRHCKDPMTDDSRMTSWRSKRSTFHREDTAATDV